MYQVLIVDDEEIVCRGMAQFIKWEQSGFEMAGIAFGVDEAMRMLEKLHIDVIFTDIRMPEKSGIDLLKNVQEQYPDIQTVVLSGYSDFDYAKDAIRYGAKEYLTKPVNLGEVEELLGRIAEKLNQRNKELQIHTGHMEGLLLSIARGYTKVDPEKLNLPHLDCWYGISVFMTEKNADEDQVALKKKEMKQNIAAVMPSAIIVDSSVYSLFVIVSVQEEKEFHHFVAILEQVCCAGCWALGISREKWGIEHLAEAFKETEQAMRYVMADMRKKVIFYQNIEKLFSEKSSQVQKILTEFLCKLNGGENQHQIINWLKQALTIMEYTEQMSVVEFQTVCIRFLIEISGHLNDMGVEQTSLHDQLNDVLRQMLWCDKSQDVLQWMLTYLDWVTQKLDHSNNQKNSGGVIVEIQSYIRQHYSENITLNMLAELYYMHPNYLSRLFKDKTGQNFIEYLVDVRMQKVKELLRTTDCKIIEICSMVGYDNPRSFSKAFKHHTGLTPKEYREKIHEKIVPAESV